MNIAAQELDAINEEMETRKAVMESSSEQIILKVHLNIIESEKKYIYTPSYFYKNTFIIIHIYSFKNFSFVKFN